MTHLLHQSYATAERSGSNFTLGAVGTELEFNSLTANSGDVSLPVNGQFRLAGGKRYLLFAMPHVEFVATNDRVYYEWFEVGGSALGGTLGQIFAVTRTADERTGITPAIAIIDTAIGSTFDVECQITSISGGGILEAGTGTVLIMEI